MRTRGTMDIPCEQDVKDVISAYQNLTDRAVIVAYEYSKITGDHWDPIEAKQVEFGDRIYVAWEKVYRGEADNYAISFPLDYLWRDDWKRELIESLDKKRREAAEKKRLEQERQIVEQEKHEKLLLKRLKAKYEPES